MNSDDHAPKILGIAFLLQAVTSLASGVILKVALIVPGNISETMIRIANHPWLMRAILRISQEYATAGRTTCTPYVDSLRRPAESVTSRHNIFRSLDEEEQSGAAARLSLVRKEAITSTRRTNTLIPVLHVTATLLKPQYAWAVWAGRIQKEFPATVAQWAAGRS